MVFIVGDTLRHQAMVVSHMSVLQFRGPITYCVLQWCHPMLTGTQRRTSCSTRMITLYGDHVIKLDSGPRKGLIVVSLIVAGPKSFQVGFSVHAKTAHITICKWSLYISQTYTQNISLTQVQTAKTDMYGECYVLIICVDFVSMALSANLFSK